MILIDEQCDVQSLFLLTGTVTNPWNNSDIDVQLRLPSSFSSFLNDAENDMWTKMFDDNYWVFHARRHNRNNSTLFIDSLAPISDIFYVLQTLAPGRFLIVRIDDYSEYGEDQTTRALPSEEWVKDHERVLEHVLGSKQRYQQLVAAVAPASSTSFQSERIRSSYDYDPYDDDSTYYTDMWGQRQPLDYLACSSECGYCGRCDY